MVILTSCVSFRYISCGALGLMRKKNNNNVPKIIRKYFQIFLQKIILSINLFLKNELLNHAGAAAFFFLLSVTPIFLLLLLSFDHYLTSYPYVSDNFFVFLKNVNENLDKDLLIKFGLLNVKTTAIGVFGLLNLLWAGRWILTSIHRGLRIAFPAETISTPMVIKILSFLILSILLLISVLVTFVSIGFNFFQFFIPDNLIGQTFFQFLLPAIRRFLPFLIAFLVIFLTYRFVPVKKPTTVSSLIGAVWCALAIILLQMLFSRFFSITQFNVIYGVLGSLILMVLWVHFCFVLFFFFAEHVFVSDKIDVLVLERMYFFRLRQDIKGKKIEKFLFRHPKRIFEKYARRYKPGEILFREGDRGTDIYFIYSGSIGISRTIDGVEHKLATLEEGEVFGEMAYLLNESRTATAIAETESVLIVIIPDIFEELLQADNIFSRNVIQLLTNRLRKTHLPEKP